MSASKIDSETHDPASRPKNNRRWNSELERVYVLAAARIRGEKLCAHPRSEISGPRRSRKAWQGGQKL